MQCELRYHITLWRDKLDDAGNVNDGKEEEVACVIGVETIKEKV